MESLTYMLEKGTSGCLDIAIHVPLPPTRREGLITLSVGSTKKGLLTSSESIHLKKWVSASPTTTGTYTSFSTPRMGRSNLTRMN